MSNQKYNTSLQLWSLREHARKDFADTLRKVGEWGVTRVELFPGLGSLGAKEAAEALRASGIEPIGLHCLWKDLEGDRGALVATAETLGIEDVVLAAVPREACEDAKACRALAKEMETVGRDLAERGMRLSFHNHSWEFGRAGEKFAADILLGETSPELVSWEPDIFHCWETGQDPVEWIQRYGDRLRLVHFKDGTGPKQAGYFGEGAIDFGRVLEALPDRELEIVMEIGPYDEENQLAKVEAAWRRFRGQLQA